MYPPQQQHQPAVSGNSPPIDATPPPPQVVDGEVVGCEVVTGVDSDASSATSLTSHPSPMYVSAPPIANGDHDGGFSRCDAPGDHGAAVGKHEADAVACGGGTDADADADANGESVTALPAMFSDSSGVFDGQFHHRSPNASAYPDNSSLSFQRSSPHPQSFPTLLHASSFDITPTISHDGLGHDNTTNAECLSGTSPTTAFASSGLALLPSHSTSLPQLFPSQAATPLLRSSLIGPFRMDGPSASTVNMTGDDQFSFIDYAPEPFSAFEKPSHASDTNPSPNGSRHTAPPHATQASSATGDSSGSDGETSSEDRTALFQQNIPEVDSTNPIESRKPSNASAFDSCRKDDACAASGGGSSPIVNSNLSPPPPPPPPPPPEGDPQAEVPPPPPVLLQADTNASSARRVSDVPRPSNITSTPSILQNLAFSPHCSAISSPSPNPLAGTSPDGASSPPSAFSMPFPSFYSSSPSPRGVHSASSPYTFRRLRSRRHSRAMSGEGGGGGRSLASDESSSALLDFSNGEDQVRCFCLVRRSIFVVRYQGVKMHVCNYCCICGSPIRVFTQSSASVVVTFTLETT